MSSEMSNINIILVGSTFVLSGSLYSVQCTMYVCAYYNIALFTAAHIHFKLNRTLVANQLK